MDNKQRVEKFNYFELLLFKITLGIFGLSIALTGLVFVAVTRISDIPDGVEGFAVLMIFVSGINFILSIIRIFKYLLKIMNLENNIGILRSVISFFLSPISLAIYLFIVIVMSLSSCTIV